MRYAQFRAARRHWRLVSELSSKLRIGRGFYSGSGPRRIGRHGDGTATGTLEEENGLPQALIPIHQWPKAGRVRRFVYQPVGQFAAEERVEIIARARLPEDGLLNILDYPAFTWLLDAAP